MRGLVHVTSLVELLHMRLVTERRSAMARDLLMDRLCNLTSPLTPPSHGRHEDKVFLQLPCHVKKHVLCQPGSAPDKKRGPSLGQNVRVAALAIWGPSLGQNVRVAALTVLA